MKTYSETRVQFKLQELDKDGKEVEVVKVFPEKKYTKLCEEAKAAGVPEPELLKIQTFSFSDPETLAEALELTKQNEALLVAHLVRATTLTQQKEAVDLLMDSDFATVEGVYDLSYSIAEVTERRKATPKEKMLKLLSQLSPEAVAEIIADFQRSTQAA